jgi:hypothetical protein
MIDLVFIEKQMRDYEVKHGERPNILRVSPNTWNEVLSIIVFSSGPMTGVETMKLLGAAIIRDPKVPDGIFEMSVRRK